ncbi:MAG: hypothetical protein ABID64_01885 [Nitrospirota bacterium]
MKNYIKHLVISFVAAIVTIFAVYGGYSIYAADTSADYNKFYEFKNVNNSDGFIFLKSQYHSDMNDYFNFKFAQLTELVDKEVKFYDHKDFKAPESDTNLLENCKTNVSTYCVAIGATDLYIAYLEKLNAMKGTMPTTVTSSSSSIKLVVDLVATRGDEIDKDAKDAKIVLEAAVNVYKEFQSAYPMHKKYKEIIDNLTKYKIALGKIREQTDTFPLRFVDATSDQCP